MEGLLPDARKEQIFDDFNDTSTTSTRSISSISSTTSNGYIEIHHNGNFLSFLFEYYSTVYIHNNRLYISKSNNLDQSKLLESNEYYSVFITITSRNIIYALTTTFFITNDSGRDILFSSHNRLEEI
ncbi:unnamed protein product [Rotaria magnacalcarata]|uniref:Uncharacterized protein n=1 Tax=Rotaria magnacalcarata TaxID=392030 RepID=A0A820D154_9BILA|nr:unnamed protein product [Rotaria magnacalcarata]